MTISRPWLGRGGFPPHVVRQPRPATERKLTIGEIAMAQKVFAASVKYDAVRVHKGRFLPGSGDNAMTPFGEMYFPPNEYRDDFSLGADSAKIWFIHEMAHVWQYHLGLCVMCNGITLGFRGGYGEGAPAYDYDPVLDKDKKLPDFNMEQQGDLIAHYFDARHLAGNGKLHARRVGLLPFYQAVLADFLKNPADAKLLPKHARVGR